MCSWIKCACLYFHSVVGCHRPPVPTHGSTEGLFHHSGARITFRCDPGFELRGFGTAICLSDGTWSAPAPECGKIMMGIVFSTNKFKCGFWSSHMCFCLSLNAIQYILPQRWCTFWKKDNLQLHQAWFFFSVSSASGKSLHFTTQANTWWPLPGLWTQWCPHCSTVLVLPALWTQWGLPENLPP